MATSPRSGGQIGGGLLLMLLGAWGALIPFVGPYFGYAFTPDKTWTYTSGRLWLSVAPGAAAFVGGLLMLLTPRIGASLAALGGIWFVIGRPVIADAVKSSTITAGSPVSTSGATYGPSTMHFLENLGFFYGLGVVIVFVAALALGRAAAARGTNAHTLDDAVLQGDEYSRAY
jgi:hypothetical protein